MLKSGAGANGGAAAGAGAGGVKKGSGKGGGVKKGGGGAHYVNHQNPQITMSAWRWGERDRVTHPNRTIEAACD